MTAGPFKNMPYFVGYHVSEHAETKSLVVSRDTVIEYPDMDSLVGISIGQHARIGAGGRAINQLDGYGIRDIVSIRRSCAPFEFNADSVVVSRGLSAGEKVVTAGINSLADGQSVKLETEVN